MKSLNLTLAFTVMMGLFAATPAWARRGERVGVNFGTTVRILDNDDKTLAGEGSPRNTKVSSSSQEINPYIGYSFGTFNLGLMLSAETKSIDSTETNVTDGSETERSSSISGKGASLFARFLFGEVFFFESGAGLYEEKQQITMETKSSTTGAYLGERDQYQVKGVGPGYHMGAGIELQMGGGFFFTSAYQVRIVQLRDYKGGSELGSKRSKSQKRELLFGISHYYK